MDYFIYIVSTFFVLLVLSKVLLGEVEGRMARKNTNMLWYIKYNTKFSYQRTRSLVFICVMCFLLSSLTEMFTMMWLLELIGFIAVGIIGDGIGQLLGYYYIQFRFKKDLQRAKTLKNEIDLASSQSDLSSIEYPVVNYDINEISHRYINNDTHLAIISNDGGDFASKYTSLPPITYVVEGQEEKAKATINDENIKVTTLTPEGQLPFKDEKIDVILNNKANYDKFELYRTLKPGGLAILNQLGSENYQQIINMFIPFRIKGSWDKANCEETLKEIGFDILESYAFKGALKFKSLASVFTFMKNLSPERVEKYEVFINFYAKALVDIKTNDFFYLTVDDFLVVAKKREIV